MNFPGEAELIDMERRARWYLSDDAPITGMYQNSPSMACFHEIEVQRAGRAAAGRPGSLAAGKPGAFPPSLQVIF